MQDKRACSRPQGTSVFAVHASAALGLVPIKTADLPVVVQNILFLRGSGGKNKMWVGLWVLDKHMKISKKAVL